MYNARDSSIPDPLDDMMFRLTGFQCDPNSVMRYNNKKLSVNGDMYFLTSLKYWKTILGDKIDCQEKCTDILEHYEHRIRGISGEERTAKADERLVRELLQDNPFFHTMTLKKERVCLFFNRPLLMKYAVRMVKETDSNYGRIDNGSRHNISVDVQIRDDETSQITSKRLGLIQSVCQKILDLKGYCSPSRSTCTIILTSKAQEETSNKCAIYVCGVVRNFQTNTKERTITYQEYLDAKIEAVTKLNKQNYPRNFGDEPNESEKKFFFQKMAKTITIFELLSVQPCRPVSINLQTNMDKSHTNAKDALFILYNYARLTALLNKFWSKVRSKEYPWFNRFDDAENINFSLLDDEDEWELVYDFVFLYPQVIKESITFKPNLKICPHNICMFLSRLSHKFSIYYRKTKILTKYRYDPDAPNLYETFAARIHMLLTLHTVFRNALAILDIEPVFDM